jgi:hypothetical protein
MHLISSVREKEYGFLSKRLSYFFKHPKLFVAFLLAKHTRLWEESIVEESSEYRLRVVDWIDMAQDRGRDRDRDRWRTPMHAVKKRRVL